MTNQRLTIKPKVHIREPEFHIIFNKSINDQHILYLTIFLKDFSLYHLPNFFVLTFFI